MRLARSAEPGQAAQVTRQTAIGPTIYVTALVWLLLATVGLYSQGWAKWTTTKEAGLPDSLVCGRLRPSYPTFEGSCEVPSYTAYGLAFTTLLLLVVALLGILDRRRLPYGYLQQSTEQFATANTSVIAATNAEYSTSLDRARQIIEGD